MKTCTRCKTDKELELFMKRASSSDGYGSWCKPCLKVYEQERIAKDPEVFYARKLINQQNAAAKNQQLLIEYFGTHHCVDCGSSDIRVLQFDHRDRTLKMFNIADKLSNSWAYLSKEIEKCDVRCANCHTIRTGLQFGTWRSKIVI